MDSFREARPLLLPVCAIDGLAASIFLVFGSREMLTGRFSVRRLLPRRADG